MQKVLGKIGSVTVYYFEGNFYAGTSEEPDFLKQLKKLVSAFMKQHRPMVYQDRKKPEYKTLVQLMEEQCHDLD